MHAATLAFISKHCFNMKYSDYINTAPKSKDDKEGSLCENTILKDVTRNCKADVMTRHQNNIKYYKKIIKYAATSTVAAFSI